MADRSCPEQYLSPTVLHDLSSVRVGEVAVWVVGLRQREKINTK